MPGRPPLNQSRCCVSTAATIASKLKVDIAHARYYGQEAVGESGEVVMGLLLELAQSRIIMAKRKFKKHHLPAFYIFVP